MLKTSWGVLIVAIGLLFAVLALPVEYRRFLPCGIAGIVICSLGILFAEVRERREKKKEDDLSLLVRRKLEFDEWQKNLHKKR
jgi:hypothetical protein